MALGPAKKGKREREGRKNVAIIMSIWYGKFRRLSSRSLQSYLSVSGVERGGKRRREGGGESGAA